MKRLILSFILMAAVLNHSAAQSISKSDSTALTTEDVTLILGMFDGGRPSEIIPKVDMLMNTAKNPEQKAFIAETTFDYYKKSKIMGYDELAVYVADTYILSGNVKLADRDKYIMIKLYADTNRASLIGLPAPELTLPDIQGVNIPLLTCRGDYKLVLFYEDACPVCRRQIPALMKYLSTLSGCRLTLYRVYTQADREKWVNWVAEATKTYQVSPSVSIVDVWDPDMKSDFVHKYGVLATPQILLLDRNNIIIGRGLTAKAVEQLIAIYNNQPGKYDAVFDPIFQPIVYGTDQPDFSKITSAIDTFFNDSKDNPDFFHESMFYLYQYLKSQQDYNLQKGAAYLAEEYIVKMPSMWEGVTFTDEGETSGSTLRADFGTVKEFITQTSESLRRFRLNPLAETVTDLSLATPDGTPANILGTTSKYTILYFYSTGCAVCEASTADMKKLAEEYKDADVTFLAIYTGTDKTWPSTLAEETPNWKEVWDRKGKSGMKSKFDLDGLPRIYVLDSGHKILGKDLNPATVGEILNILFPKEK